MKVNNMTKFFAENEGDASFLAAKKRSTIVTRGDIIKLYAAKDSDSPGDWHVDVTEQDKWWKMSFDAGNTFPVKMKFDETPPSFAENVTEEKIILDHGPTAWIEELIEEKNEETDEVINSYYITKLNVNRTFMINADIYEDLRDNGTVNVSLIDEDGFASVISNFKYKYDDSTNGIIIKIDDKFIGLYSGLQVTIKLGGSASNVASVPTPVYSMLISAIPSVYDSTYGVCNYLDDEIQTIECVTKLNDINVLKIKVVSSSPDKSGNIRIQLTCGSWSSGRLTIPATSTETWFEIPLDSKLNGTLVITRHYDDALDTLNDKINGINAISAIITQIKVESI